jgi:hypothetical protein
MTCNWLISNGSSEHTSIQHDTMWTLSLVTAKNLNAVVRQNEIVSSHEVKSRANLSRPVVVAA